MLCQVMGGLDAVGRVVVGGELAQPQNRAVVLCDVDQFARGVVGGDFLAAFDGVEAARGITLRRANT